MSTLAAFGALAILGAWTFAENRLLLRTAEYRVRLPLPRTVLIADLHKRKFGERQEGLLRAVAAQQPQIIAIAGDLVSRTERNFTPTAHLLHALREMAPVVMVPGNHETDLPPECYQQYRRAAADAGAILLENEYCEIAGVRFAGAVLSREQYVGGGLLKKGAKTPCTAQMLTQLLGRCPQNTVLLAHNPLFFPAYAEWGAALTLAGHVHGGSVRLPYIGGVLSPERTFFPKYDRGYFCEGSAEMVLSGGLGKLRLFNPPEICVLTGGPQPLLPSSYNSVQKLLTLNRHRKG